MRRTMSAGVLVALALLVPAAPATAQAPQAAQPGLSEACKTVERKVFKDFRKLVTIDLNTATDIEVRVLANQIMAAAKAESLPVLPRAVQAALDGTPDELRAFLKTSMQKAWRTDLRISVGRTLADAGPNVEAAAQKVLSAGGIDAYLAYLNEGVYLARELDCKSQPSASPSVTPSVTSSATTPAEPVPSSSAGTGGTPGGEGGGLPLTGADTATVVGVGSVLLLLGGVGFLIGRRRRSRFEA